MLFFAKKILLVLESIGIFEIGTIQLKSKIMKTIDIGNHFHLDQGGRLDGI
jgi:hypothetical protein